MTMEHAAIAPKNLTAERDEAADNWPRLTWRARVAAAVLNGLVTAGWTLKNHGMPTIGLWLVNVAHRRNSVSG